MLRVLGKPRQFCDGVTRREAMTVGALSVLGGAMSLSTLLASEERHATAGKAKNVTRALPARRGADAGHVRPEAERARRDPRRIQADRHQRPRHPDLRAPAANREVDASLRHRPLGQPQGGLPQHAAELHRQRAAGGHQRPDPEGLVPAGHGRGLRVPQAAGRRPAALRRRARRRSAGASRSSGPARGAASSASATIRCAASASRRIDPKPPAGRRPMWLGTPYLADAAIDSEHDDRPPRRPPQPARSRSTTSSAASRSARPTHSTAFASGPSAC